MDIEKITHRTRPDSVFVYSQAARDQVKRTVAALAHHEQDNDAVSLARATEARSALVRINELDAALKEFRNELDTHRKVVQDGLNDMQDRLRKLAPSLPIAVKPYTTPAPKGTTNVQPTGKAKQAGPPPSAGGAGVPSTSTVR